MKHIAKKYHIWVDSRINKVVGKVVELKGNDTIDNYREVELPEELKILVDKINTLKKK